MSGLRVTSTAVTVYIQDEKKKGDEEVKMRRRRLSK